MRLSAPLKVAPTEAVCKGHQGGELNIVVDTHTGYILSVEETGTQAWHNRPHAYYFILIFMPINGGKTKKINYCLLLVYNEILSSHKHIKAQVFPYRDCSETCIKKFPLIQGPTWHIWCYS